MKKKNEDFISGAPKKKIVGVIGAADADEDLCVLARQIGRIIAEKGYMLVCGGLGGVMNAACRGASEVGGLTIGILPGNSKISANPYVSIPIVTAMSHARNAIIARTADIIVAVGGRYGTLSEIAHTKALGKRVLAMHSWPEIPSVEYFENISELTSELSEF